MGACTLVVLPNELDHLFYGWYFKDQDGDEDGLLIGADPLNEVLFIYLYI